MREHIYEFFLDTTGRPWGTETICILPQRTVSCTYEQGKVITLRYVARDPYEYAFQRMARGRV